jgi:type I restriction enzyme R subunit
MNGLPERQTAETFKRSEYRFLVVANKFQTGFDQPLLHTMYVDKKLGGVNAVQTLSRLNRIYPGKNSTLVLDFANAADEIEKAFAPYYDRTILSEATDPNKLYDLQTKLRGFDFYLQDEVDRFATLYYTPRSTQDKLHAALAPIVERYMAAIAEDRADFRGSLNDYVRLYAFLSQVISWVDADLEKFYVFAKLLLRKLPVSRDELPVEIQRNIDIESLAVRKTGSGTIRLQLGADPLAPMGPLPAYTVLPQELEALSQIIKLLNERFGTDFSDDDKLCIQQLEQRLETNDALEASVRANTLQNARLTFDLVVHDLLQDMIDGHFKFYKQVTDNEEFARALLDWLFERYLTHTKAPTAVPRSP